MRFEIISSDETPVSELSINDTWFQISRETFQQKKLKVHFEEEKLMNWVHSICELDKRCPWQQGEINRSNEWRGVELQYMWQVSNLCVKWQFYEKDSLHVFANTKN